MFASRSLTVHLVRGAIGATALLVLVAEAPSHPFASLLGLPIALVALRGCPMCWTIGLVQTVVAKLRKRSTAALCTDGSCQAGLARSPSAHTDGEY